MTDYIDEILTEETIDGFTWGYLAANYDNPRPIPSFHMEMWELCCSDASKVAIAAPREHAKAQSVDSRILTPNGWTTIGNLSVGDQIIGDGGAAKTVTRLHPISDMDLYRVTTADGKSTLCNLDHLWLCEIPSNVKRLQLKTLKEILENWKTDRQDKRTDKCFTEYRYRIPVIDPVQFEEKNFEVDPYTLGLWLGDGHAASGRITTADPEVLDNVAYSFAKQSGNYLYKIEGLYQDLQDLGVLDNKHVPETYLFGSVEQRLALLRGLMDSDGTISKIHGQVSFCNTNKSLVNSVVSLIRSLGGIAAVSEAEAKLYGKSCGLYWRVTVKMGTCPFFLPRKVRYWSPHKRLYSYIVGIDYEKTAPGRCLTVNGRLYVTDDYLLTHNSTAITHAFILAAVCLGVKDFVLLVSGTETQASEFLMSIKAELEHNRRLRKDFHIKSFLKETETNIIVLRQDGTKFRIQAKGSEQKVRGIKWENKRPDLIVCDDLEEDEQVMNPERREKFRRWFMNALVPCGSDTCSIRVVGTILHLDSMLNRLMSNKAWKNLFYRAHDDDFENLLWPEKFSEERLQEIQLGFIEDGNPEGYSQEYLNQPVDIKRAFFKKDYFYDFERDKDGEWIKPNLEYFAAADFAISEKEKADFTVIIVGGVDPKGVLHIVDVNRFKTEDGGLICDELIDTQKHYNPSLFTFETAQIDKAIGSFLDKEMRKQRTFLNIEKVTPTQSKTMRGRSIQAMHRSGAIRYDRKSSWFDPFEAELMMVADSGPRGRHDDQFDAFAYLGLTIDQHYEAQSEEELEDEEYDIAFEEHHDEGRDHTTGY